MSGAIASCHCSPESAELWDGVSRCAEGVVPSLIANLHSDSDHYQDGAVESLPNRSVEQEVAAGRAASTPVAMIGSVVARDWRDFSQSFSHSPFSRTRSRNAFAHALTGYSVRVSTTALIFDRDAVEEVANWSDHMGHLRRSSILWIDVDKPNEDAIRELVDQHWTRRGQRGASLRAMMTNSRTSATSVRIFTFAHSRRPAPARDDELTSRRSSASSPSAGS